MTDYKQRYSFTPVGEEEEIGVYAIPIKHKLEELEAQKRLGLF